MVTSATSRSVDGSVGELLEAEAKELVAGDQALGLGRVLTALDRMAKP